jgi:hypothetical protein
VNFLLNAIGFIIEEQRERIMASGLANYEDFCYLVEKDIRDMADEFGKRSQQNGRIIFGLGRTTSECAHIRYVEWKCDFHIFFVVRRTVA